MGILPKPTTVQRFTDGHATPSRNKACGMTVFFHVLPPSWVTLMTPLSPFLPTLITPFLKWAETLSPAVTHMRVVGREMESMSDVPEGAPCRCQVLPLSSVDTTIPALG